MNEKIFQLKKLNAAYVATVEFGGAFNPQKAEELWKMWNLGLTVDELAVALDENKGKVRSQILDEMSALIRQL